jgi:hypothetical protein
LTIKFARSIQKLLAISFWLIAKTSRIRLRKPYGAVLLIARTSDRSDLVHQQNMALIKIYISLVDCPIYSVVKHRPHRSCQSSAFSYQPKNQQSKPRDPA